MAKILPPSLISGNASRTPTRNAFACESKPPSRRSTPHGALGLPFLAITHSQLTEQVASPHSSDRPRKVELDPVRASLDVGTAPTPCEQVKVEERLVARVEDARPLLDDAGPGPQVSEQVREVIEQLWRTIGHGSGHGSAFRPLRKTSSAQPDLSARATSCALSASAGSARAPTSCASRDRSRARTRSPRRQPYAGHLEGCWHALPDRQPARLCPRYRTRRYRASAGERSEERTCRPAADRTVSGRSG